ncbi:hypothetical protein PybrP1_005253 [[Pythium] brassicae (nom. inval.)]|nr:hypothetical protein PybrP1_005253 [[Pythium] brassicae (nom. inval.)]
MEVALVPVLGDNYAYLLIDTANRVAAAIDPVEPEKVLARAKELGVAITTILTTHSHWDHAGGNGVMKELAEQHLLASGGDSHSVPVVGGKGDDVQDATLEVEHGDVVRVGALQVRVFQTPCHTRGHVLYLCDGALFTGDTLFVAGCGRFFSGSPAEMHHALNTVVAKLPLDTKVYCGHEYTASNLRFAAHVEPANAAVRAKLAWAVERSQQGEPTVPSTVEDELATNPFMRVHEPAVQQFAVGGATADLAAVMGALRSAKDQFGIGKGKI